MKNIEFVNSEFKSLLSKFQTGNCNPEELRRLEEMFSDKLISDTIKSEMLDEIQEFETIGTVGDTDFNQLFRTIRKAITERQSHKRRINLQLNLMRVAAIVVIAFLIGGTLSYFLLRTGIKKAESCWEISAPLG
jgi:hypothetical protein